MTNGLNLLRAALTALVLAAFALPASAQIPASERQVLVNLYNSTNGAGWNTNSGWLDSSGTECFTWHGVTCNDSNDHVLGLFLPDNNLVGTLPSLSGLTELRYVLLYENQIAGSIPSLSGMTSLVNFNVRDNEFTGSIPSLSGLTSLQGFLIDNNQLTGSIPSLSDLTSLYRLDVQNNQLTGSIPSLSALTSFHILRIQSNHLTGTPPAAPATLYVGDSILCPNSLHAPSPTDAAWDAATGESPWWQNCDPVFADGFEP